MAEPIISDQHLTQAPSNVDTSPATDVLSSPPTLPLIHTWQFRVRTYELDRFGKVRTPVFQNYIEEVATQASASYGYDYAWYIAHGHIWVARKHTIRFFQPLAYPEELTVRTWINGARRVQGLRQYDMRRTSDGVTVMRGQTIWVYVNFEQMRPAKVPDEFLTVLTKDPDDVQPLDAELSDPHPLSTPLEYVEVRKVERILIDPAGHMNNSFYAAWVEEAIDNAIEKVILRAQDETPATALPHPTDGTTAGLPLVGGLYMHPYSREIEYLRAAMEGESIKLIVRLMAFGGADGNLLAWHTEFRHVETDELCCKDTTIRALTDSHGTPANAEELIRLLVG